MGTATGIRLNPRGKRTGKRWRFGDGPKQKGNGKHTMTRKQFDALVARDNERGY